MEHVEKWCRKRKYCWTLPVSVFSEAVKYDNFFRCMCCFYSRQWIEQKTIIKRYFYYGNMVEEMRLATTEDVLLRWSQNMKWMFLVPIDSNVDELVDYEFEEHDLAWAREEYNGWSFLPYDMDVVLLKIAFLQASCFGLPRVITQLIAQFAKETLTRNDRCKGDGGGVDRNFAIRTKRKHLEAIQ